MRQSGKIELPENAAAWRACYSGVRNTARGIVLAAEKGKSGESYNIADSEAFTELEWRGKIARLMNWGGEILVTPSAAAGALPGINAGINYAQYFTIDSSKIRRELGYADICSAEEQLMEIVGDCSAS
jgi:nucleoside-diphosphate-sugar epimerase